MVLEFDWLFVVPQFSFILPHTRGRCSAVMWTGMFDEQLEDMLKTQRKLFPPEGFLGKSGLSAVAHQRLADWILEVRIVFFTVLSIVWSNACSDVCRRLRITAVIERSSVLR